MGLLKQLLQKKIFAEARLAGGTALALQYGHRKSVDLDFFGVIEADPITITEELKSVGETVILKRSPRINIYSVNGVKVDVVNYPYEWIEETVVLEDLRLAHPRDIAAMKLAAITGRGTKKDFFDLYFLLQHFELSDMIQAYNQKFTDGSAFMVLKSIIYFDDAETDEDPVLLKKVPWKKVKSTVLQKYKAYINNVK